MGLIEELKWRGMIQDMMPGTEEQIAKEMTTAYIGFDPTAESLHIGSLVPILLLLHWQRAGHKPIALVGGATGMVGDPSGKSEERNLLSEEQLEKNLQGIKKQLSKYLDFNPALPNAASIVNNYDWFKGMTFIEFLRDVGKHITVNYMMAKDSVRKRIEGETGISYTEFAYQLMQGYDFYWLYKNHHCKIQMGGSDQWGNITTGTELIRRKAGGEAFAFTCPLLTKTDGTKFGKTEKGNVWLDPEKTSYYEFYQFWVRAADADAAKWIRIFTFLPAEEINQLIEIHQQKPEDRQLQKKLAEEITRFVHGEEGLRTALETTEKLHLQSHGSASELSLEDLESMEGVTQFSFDRQKLNSGIDIISFLAETGIFPSKGEARKMLQNGGVSLNREKITDLGMLLTSDRLLHQQYLLLQKGKKHFFLVKAT